MNGPFRIGEWILEPDSHRLRRGDTTHIVRAKLIRILVCFAEEPGRVLQRDDLLDRIWPGIVVTDDSLTRGVSDLRKLLGDSAEEPRYIETIRKGGYRLIAPVECLADAGQATLASEAHAEPQAAAEAVPEAAEAAAPETPPSPTPPSPTLGPSRGVARVRLAAAALLVVTGLAAWLVPSAAAPVAPELEARPLTALIGRETNPAVSPDGSRVAFAWSGVHGLDHDLYVKSLRGDELLRLTRDPASDSHPAWSPDGQRVAFLRSGPDGSGIHVVPAAGGPVEFVAATSSWVHGLDWSPDGRSLVFSGSEAGSGPHRVRRVSLDTRLVDSLSEPPPLYSDHSAVFSPRGSAVAFVRRSWTDAVDAVVFVDGEGRELAAFPAEGFAVRGLEWAADEEHLLVAAEVGDAARLFRMSVADGELTEIRTREEHVRDPSLSSDGGTLIYESAAPRQRLYRARLAGAGAPPAIEPILSTTRNDREVDHSPDGARIAVVSDRTGPSELWLTDVDGANPVRLTDSGAALVRSPRWSPDGRRIAYLQEAGGQSHLWVVTVERDRRRVAAFQSAVALSDWTGDGAGLYVSTRTDGAWRPLCIELDGGRATSVAEPEATVVKESSDGRWLLFSKAQQKGIWRMPIEGGASELVVPSFDPIYTPSWGVLGNGLFYGEWNETCTRLSFLDLDTRERSTLVEAPWRHASGFSLSPSGDELIISLTDRGGSDLNVIERFAMASL